MTVNITLTLPERVIDRIDKDRCDVNRSKFVLRLIEMAYGYTPTIKQRKKGLQQTEPRVGTSHVQSVAGINNSGTAALECDSEHE